MDEAIKRFSDFAIERGPLDGSKVKLDEILNVEIKITAFDVRPSKYPKENHNRVMTLQFEIKETMHVVFTGSEILIKQMEKYSDNLPFMATIRHIDRYYTLS